MVKPPHLPAFFDPYYLSSVTSTNDEMKIRARAGASEGTLIVAKEQKAGRGRNGRQWISKPGNLYMSLLLRPKGNADTAAQVSFLAAVALAESIKSIAPNLTPQLKWPNDILIDGAKISGILLESSSQAVGKVDWLVVGIGVNIQHHPSKPAFPSTSLNALGVSECTSLSLLEVLAPLLLRWLEIWNTSGFSPLRSAWLSLAAGLEGPLLVRLPNEEFRGTFQDLNTDGSLIIGLPDGTKRTVASGEVILPRT